MQALAELIDAVLPQTQCTRCGYPDCRSYAGAIAEHKADINQCPPGGEAGITRLAALLGVAPKPLNPANGIEVPTPPVALIDEARCIGCTLCIQACPVDAISGANLLMHTVISAACTGCELCIPPCPVDCITLVTPAAGAPPTWEQKRAAADEQRGRYHARNARVQRERDEQAGARRQRKAALQSGGGAYDPVAAALARARRP